MDWEKDIYYPHDGLKSWSDKNDRISEPFVSPDSKEYDLICLSCVLLQRCVFLLLPYDRPYHKSDSEYHWFSVQCSIPALLKHNCGDLVSAFCNNPWIFFKISCLCCTHMFLLDHGYSLQILIAVPSASYMYEYFFLYIQWYKYVLNTTEYTNCCICAFT